MQGAAAEVTGVVVPAGVVVVVKVQVQVTDVSVAPVTLAKKLTDWLTTRVSESGLTDTTTTFAVPLPPHPASHTDTAAKARAAILEILANLIPTVSPKNFSLFRRDNQVRGAKLPRLAIINSQTKSNIKTKSDIKMSDSR